MKKTSYIILASAIVILGISLIPRFVLREQKREIKSGRIEEQEFGQDKAKELVLEKKNGVYEPKKEFISEVIKTDFKFNALAPLWRDETPKNTGVKYWVRSAAGNKWGDWIEFERGGRQERSYRKRGKIQRVSGIYPGQ